MVVNTIYRDLIANQISDLPLAVDPILIGHFSSLQPLQLSIASGVSVINWAISINRID
jgi:hypothetical protein